MRLPPHASVRKAKTMSTRRSPPSTPRPTGAASESRHEQQLAELTAQLQAVYDHLDACEQDDKRREALFGARLLDLEQGDSTSRSTLAAVPSLCERLTQAEGALAEEATSTASIAAALASLASDVQALHARVDEMAATRDRHAAALREAAAAQSEIGVLRAEVNLLHVSYAQRAVTARSSWSVLLCGSRTNGVC